MFLKKIFLYLLVSLWALKFVKKIEGFEWVELGVGEAGKFGEYFGNDRYS